MKNLPKALSESSLYLEINKCKFNIVWNTKILDHSFKLKVMLSFKAALYIKVVI